MDWTQGEQRLLDEALAKSPKTLPTKERWASIAKHVGSRSSRECAERYKDLRAMLKTAAEAGISLRVKDAAEALAKDNAAAETSATEAKIAADNFIGASPFVQSISVATTVSMSMTTNTAVLPSDADISEHPSLSGQGGGPVHGEEEAAAAAAPQKRGEADKPRRRRKQGRANGLPPEQGASMGKGATLDMEKEVPLRQAGALATGTARVAVAAVPRHRPQRGLQREQCQGR